MLHIRIIKYYYLGLTVLALITPVKISFIYFVPGILLMWLFYIAFTFLNNKQKVEINFVNPETTVKNNSLFGLILTMTFLLFYPFYIRYYTGTDIYSAIMNVLLGQSNYYSYQTYFHESKLNYFSIQKLPYILMNGILRFLYILYVFKTFVFLKKVFTINKICISLMTLIIFIVGLSRGTSFELFEIFLIFLFAYSARRVSLGNKNLFSKRILILLGIFALIITTFFVYNINKRMGINYNPVYSSDFNSQSFIYQTFPSLAIGLYLLHGYFLFGLYFSSTIIIHLWFGSLYSFFSIFLPKGISLFGIDTSYRNYAGKIIELGANWNPDSMVFIDSYGIFVSFLIICSIGIFSKILYKKILNNIFALVLIFFSFYLMISFPVGNFISTSSANIIAIILALVLYKFKKANKLLLNTL